MTPIKTGLPEKNDDVCLFEIKATYIQNADSCSESRELQELTIETRDGGDGIYYSLTTKEWAFNDVSDIVNIINDFKKRLNS